MKNQLTGQIPVCLSNITNLQGSVFYENQLTGHIPAELSLLTQINFLTLYSNQLIGQIPTSLTNCTQLRTLYLVDNQLTGHIQLTKSIVISRGQNHFIGPIRPYLSRLTNLQKLYLWGNRLSSNIPNSLSNCTQLQILALFDNQLRGAVPLELAKFLLLERLYLYNNQLVSASSDTFLPILTALTNCFLLQNLALDDNYLTGFLPCSIGQGSIPSTLNRFSKIERLSLERNKLEGSIPMEIGQIESLGHLSLQQNMLSGQIPDSIGNLRQLRRLSLNQNQLSGNIQARLGKCRTLEVLDLSYNNLTVQFQIHLGNYKICRTWISPPTTCLLQQLTVCNTKLFSKTYNAPPAEFFSEQFVGEERITATQGFCQANLIGVGSFGRVYKGVLNDGTTVAVKVLNLQNEETHRSFARECKVLRRVRHRNIISILTSGSNLDFNSLVIPFMSNGSLNKCLYSDGDHVCGLSLTQRLNISLDIAQGMAYLHHDCFLQVVHCNLKPSNVLLDHSMTSYIADFGISRLTCGNSMDSFTTLGFLGSVGYMIFSR
eukprot:Gb_35294 [translate_table: standard]